MRQEHAAVSLRQGICATGVDYGLPICCQVLPGSAGHCFSGALGVVAHRQCGNLLSPKSVEMHKIDMLLLCCATVPIHYALGRQRSGPPLKSDPLIFALFCGQATLVEALLLMLHSTVLLVLLEC